MTDLLDRADYELGWFDAFRVDVLGADPHPARTRAAMPPAYSRGFAGYTLQQLLTRATVRYRGPDPTEVRLVCQAATARHLLVTKAADDPELAAAARQALGLPDPDPEGPEPAT